MEPALEGRMFEFFAIAIAVVALIIARKAQDQTAGLKARLDAIEASEWRAPQAPPPLVPAEPPAPAAETAAAAPVEPTPLHEAPPYVPDDAADAPRLTPAAPPPVPPASPGFEERVGTRWVVWLGGLTLADRKSTRLN